MSKQCFDTWTIWLQKDSTIENALFTLTNNILMPLMHENR
jgi:hypothetical protein